MWWEPKQAHPATSRQTSETADYNPVAPSTGVPTAGRKTPGAVRRSAAVLVESKGVIRIQRREVLGHINKDSAHQFPDVAQRMPFRHPLLKREVGKQSSLIPKSPAHRQIALVASLNSDARCNTPCRFDIGMVD